ncbi:MAG: thioesterase family protein [Actinomycetota bacterium]
MTDAHAIGEIDFDRALALEPVGEGLLAASIAEGWDIRGVPHGGYLLAMLAAAAGTAVPQPHPLSVSATYLAAPTFDRAELSVRVIRVGSRQSTVEVGLAQDGVDKVRASVTLGTLSDAQPVHLADDADRPDAADPASYLAPQRPNGERLSLHDRVEVRLAPGTGFQTGRPTGVALLDGFMRFVNGRPPDPLALLLFSDGLPPSIFEAKGFEIGHVPTVQLTTHLFALPADGWVRSRCRTRVQGGSFLDEDADLWDETGRLVATARQLALVR